MTDATGPSTVGADSGGAAPVGVTSATDEVVSLCRDLIRIDTTNTGEADTTVGEREAAEWVAAQLDEVGVESQLHESAPGRTSLVARIPGTDPSRPALLVHGHLDVVPADPAEWSVPPFAGELRDGYLWGRGAVDMKDFDAMVLAVVRHWRRTGYRPPRDIVLAFTADEEAGSTLGARFLVERHAELLSGCAEAIGEVGGYSYSLERADGAQHSLERADGAQHSLERASGGVDGRRLYPIQTAEKGIDWLRLSATGAPGHGSMRHDANAVTVVSGAVARIGRHRFPVELTDPVREFLTSTAGALDLRWDPADPDALADRLGPLARMIGATLRDTANPTRLAAGYKENVIPGRATATIDCRTLPGHADTLLARVRELAGPEVAVEYLQRQPAVQTSFDGPLVDAMVAALQAEDPGAVPVPYMFPGGTDAKAFATLGIRCFGFSPLRLPPDLDFPALFHGIDERVPVSGLQFGVRVLDRFLRV